MRNGHGWLERTSVCPRSDLIKMVLFLSGGG
jgi:hypothetical protein